MHQREIGMRARKWSGMCMLYMHMYRSACIYIHSVKCVCKQSCHIYMYACVRWHVDLKGIASSVRFYVVFTQFTKWNSLIFWKERNYTYMTIHIYSFYEMEWLGIVPCCLHVWFYFYSYLHVLFEMCRRFIFYIYLPLPRVCTSRWKLCQSARFGCVRVTMCF